MGPLHDSRTASSKRLCPLELRESFTLQLGHFLRITKSLNLTELGEFAGAALTKDRNPSGLKESLTSKCHHDTGGWGFHM